MNDANNAHDGQQHPRQDGAMPSSATSRTSRMSQGAKKKFVEAEMAAGSADSWAKIQERKRKQQKAAKRAKRAAKQQTTAQHRQGAQAGILPLDQQPPDQQLLDPQSPGVTATPAPVKSCGCGCA